MNSANMSGEIMAEKSHCNFAIRPGAQAQKFDPPTSSRNMSYRTS